MPPKRKRSEKTTRPKYTPGPKRKRGKAAAKPLDQGKEDGEDERVEPNSPRTSTVISTEGDNSHEDDNNEDEDDEDEDEDIDWEDALPPAPPPPLPPPSQQPILRDLELTIEQNEPESVFKSVSSSKTLKYNWIMG